MMKAISDRYPFLHLLLIAALFLGCVQSCSGEKKLLAEKQTYSVENQFSNFLELNSCFGIAKVNYQGDSIYSQPLKNLKGIEGSLDGDSKVALASLSKVLTEIVALKLVEENKLSLKGTIREYRPHFHHDFGDEITVEQLINMTSGLPRECNSKGISFIDYNTRGLAGSFLDTITEIELVFPPGTQEAYSNLGYWLLGAIIESVTGQNLNDAFTNYLFAPLNMNNTGLIQSNSDDLIHGYVRQNNKWLRDTINYGGRYASGGFYSTTNDLMKLAEGLKGNHILSEKMKSELLNDSNVLEAYGYLPSHTNMLYFDFEHGLFMVVLNNVAIAEPNNMLRLKADVLSALNIEKESNRSAKVVKVLPIDSLSELHPIESHMIKWVDAIEAGTSAEIYNTLNKIAVSDAFEKTDPTWNEIIRCRNEMKGFKCVGFRWKKGTQMDGLEVWFETNSEAVIAFLWLLDDSHQKVENLFVSPSDMEWMGESY